MYVISTILLLSVPTVFGDFEQILKLQYEPAIEAQKKMDWIWKEGVLKQNRTLILRELMLSEFTFFEANGVQRDAEYFINEFLFKLNTSTAPEVFDIQNLDPPRSVKHTRELDIDLVKVALQWGGRYLYLEFIQKTMYGENLKKWVKYFPLVSVRLSQTKPRIINEFYNNFAVNITNQMVRNEDVFAPEFIYQACNNQTIKNGTELVAEKNLDLILVSDSIHYYMDQTKPARFLWISPILSHMFNI